MCSSLNGGRGVFRPAGPPIMAMKSQMRKMTVCPPEWNQRPRSSVMVRTGCGPVSTAANNAVQRAGEHRLADGIEVVACRQEKPDAIPMPGEHPVDGKNDEEKVQELLGAEQHRSSLTFRAGLCAACPFVVM